MTDIATAEYAQQLDAQDPIRQFRDEFRLPTNRGIKAELVPEDLGTYYTTAYWSITNSRNSADSPCRYFVGNSLGPLSKRSQKFLDEEIEVWAMTYVMHRHSYTKLMHLQGEWKATLHTVMTGTGKTWRIRPEEPSPC